VSKLTLSFKTKVLKIFPLQQGSMDIGSDTQCPIYIDSLAVEDRHARIETVDFHATITDMGTKEGTFVNQKRITEHKLNDGDIIRVGKHTLTYKYQQDANIKPIELNESPERLAIEPLPEKEGPEGITGELETPLKDQNLKGWLQILNGQNLGKTLSLNKSMTNIGKPGVATAVITRRQDGYFISHLEGKRPPKVSGEPINDRSIKLNDGETITIGNINMQFYLE